MLVLPARKVIFEPLGAATVSVPVPVVVPAVSSSPEQPCDDDGREEEEGNGSEPT